MGTLIGHVAPGIGFILIGLWHLMNAIRSYVASPWTFEGRAWYPVPQAAPDSSSRHFRFRSKLKHAELFLIIFSSMLSIAAELFICPAKHQPLADDLSIPVEHLNNFEHSSMSLFFLIYAAVALIDSIRRLNLPRGLLNLLAALAFSQELLLFHFHSADHMGLEGQYHWLLQLIVATCLLCVLLEIAMPASFLLVLVRAEAILFQGLWFVQMGLVLWIPRFVPKGCAMVHHDGHDAVTCTDERSTMRAKALANLQFNWYLAAVVVFTLGLYCLVSKRSEMRPNMRMYTIADDADEEKLLDAVHRDSADDRNGRFKHKNSGSHSSIEMEGFPALDLER